MRTITLKKLIELISEVKMESVAGSILEDRAPSVNAQIAGGDVSPEKAIPFPTIKITEAWGDPHSEDRKILELLMKNVSGDTVEEKLASVKEFLEYQPGRKINEIFSNLLFTEIFSSIMDEYNASTTGFLFEAFLAGLFGGERSFQLSDKDEETGNLPIVDVELKGIPYSLKVLSKTTDVKGSFFNLVNHFDNSDYLIYLVVEKEGEGVLAFREFRLDADTFLSYIGYAEAGKEVVKRVDITGVHAKYIGLDKDEPRELDAIPNVGTYVYTHSEEGQFPKDAGLEVGKDYDIIGKLKKSSGGKRIHTKWEEDEVYDIIIDAGTETKRTVKKGKGGTIDLYGSAENYDKLKKIKDKDELFAALKNTPGYGPRPKQFVISPSYIRTTAQDVGSLDLGKEMLKAVAKQYANDLQENLIPIYRALQNLTTNTNKYFLSEEGEVSRKQHALLASANATTLRDETGKLTN